MPSSGGGTGTPIPSGGVPATIAPDALSRSCISLPRYAKLTGYSECAIYGVSNPSEAHGDCDNPIWDQYQREMILYYLAEAQEEIERVTGYPLCPTYFAGEEHPYRFPIHTRWTRVIAAGARAESDVDLAAPVDYSVEPALVGPIATALTDATEIKIFYPDSEREIEAVRTTISGGFLNIYVPRCRLVHPDYFAGQEGGLSYEDLDNFISTVDVKRVYTDDSINASLVWAHRESANTCANCGCLTCGEHTETACLYIRNKLTGAMDAVQGTFANSLWTPTCNRCYGSQPDKVRVSYLAGLNPITLQAENAVLRLAHAKMPQSVCGCEVLRSMWARDTKIPEVLTRERENCPFGMSDGAWVAWRFANAIASRRMHVW